MDSKVWAELVRAEERISRSDPDLLVPKGLAYKAVPLSGQHQVRSLTVRDMADLITQSDAVMLEADWRQTGQAATARAASKEGSALITSKSQQRRVLLLTYAVLVGHLPEPDRTAFGSLTMDAELLYVTLYLALVAIDFQRSAEGLSVLQGFVSTGAGPSRLHRLQIAAMAAPLLVGYENDATLAILTERLDREAGAWVNPQPGGEIDYHGPLVATLKSVVSAEKYCRELPKPARADFRDFYSRLHRIIPQAALLWPRPVSSVKMVLSWVNDRHKYWRFGDRRFYRSFFEGIDATEAELAFIRLRYLWLEIHKMSICCGSSPTVIPFGRERLHIFLLNGRRVVLPQGKATVSGTIGKRLARIEIK